VKSNQKDETKSDLIFDKSELVQEYIKRGIELGRWNIDSGSLNVPKWISVAKWTGFIRSEIFGFIQSRLYTGALNQELFDQNFQLEYNPGSLMDRYRWKLPVEVTVFNSTSLACDELLKLMKKTRGLKPGIFFFFFFYLSPRPDQLVWASPALQGQ